MPDTDHRAQQDQRWAKFVALACPECGLMVLALDIPLPVVWCGSCPSTPRLERSAA